MRDGYTRPRNGRTVLSTFACGGGSTMGYKLAGFDVIGCVEIDPKMMRIYKANHHPRLAFEDDVREFRKRTDLPAELFTLDVLDGSPPCSTFSTSGHREESWGVEKAFREGQKLQRLDDLFFEFIALANRLRPKVIVAENVKGMLVGNAKAYAQRVVAEIQAIGYDCQAYLLNAATMGVPQARERVFFLGRRRDLQRDPISLEFNDRPIPFREATERFWKDPDSETVSFRQKAIYRRWKDLPLGGKPEGTHFNLRRQHPSRVCNTLVAFDENVGMAGLSHPYHPRKLNRRELCACGSFPMDYDFLDAKPAYVVGMSVPPVMMARLAVEIDRQWLQRSD